MAKETDKKEKRTVEAVVFHIYQFKTGRHDYFGDTGPKEYLMLGDNNRLYSSKVDRIPHPGVGSRFRFEVDDQWYDPWSLLLIDNPIFHYSSENTAVEPYDIHDHFIQMKFREVGQEENFRCIHLVSTARHVGGV